MSAPVIRRCHAEESQARVYQTGLMLGIFAYFQDSATSHQIRKKGLDDGYCRKLVTDYLKYLFYMFSLVFLIKYLAMIEQ